MSADHDMDTRMASSPTPSTSSHEDDNENNGTINPSAILSPPDSQHDTQAMLPPAAPHANANGKRPIQTISNGADDADNEIIITGSTAVGSSSGASTNGNAGKTKQDFPTKTHQPSGYTWAKTEEEAGYAWGNKKAVDESHRAWEGVVHKDYMVKSRYGDPFEAAEREQAMINSLKQR